MINGVIGFWNGNVDMRDSSLLTYVIPVIALVSLAGVFPISTAQPSSFVAPGANPQPINFDLNGAAAGGPSVDAAGNVYFTLTQLGARTGSIEKWTWADGNVTKYRDVEGAAIGTAIDIKGRLLVGEWTAERITADDLKGKVTVLADSIDGRRLMDPNSLVVDPHGGIYFTESGNAKAQEGDHSGVDYITPDGKTVTQVANMAGARKLIISPDGKALIVSGSGSTLWRFDVAASGSLMNKQAFCATQCANPFAFDEESNVYTVGDKLYVYNLRGEKLDAIDLPHRFSNGTFAGKDRKILFLTGHDGVFTLQMRVRGAPSAIDLSRKMTR